MKKLKSISDNELSELYTLLCTITNDISGNFRHVEEFLSKSFTNTLDKEINRVKKEYQRREDEE